MIHATTGRRRFGFAPLPWRSADGVGDSDEAGEPDDNDGDDDGDGDGFAGGGLCGDAARLGAFLDRALSSTAVVNRSNKDSEDDDRGGHNNNDNDNDGRYETEQARRQARREAQAEARGDMVGGRWYSGSKRHHQDKMSALHVEIFDLSAWCEYSLAPLFLALSSDDKHDPANQLNC